MPFFWSFFLSALSSFIFSFLVFVWSFVFFPSFNNSCFQGFFVSETFFWGVVDFEIVLSLLFILVLCCFITLVLRTFVG